MKRPKRDPVREDHIHNQAIVNSGCLWVRREGNELVLLSRKQAYVSFQGPLHSAQATSPRRKGETVEVRRLAKEEACESLRPHLKFSTNIRSLPGV